MIWSYRVKGWTVSQLLKRNPQKASGRLLCEANHASLTNKCLTAPAMCTVPDPNPRPSTLHDFSSSTTRHGDQVTSIHTNIISSTEFSIMLGVARRESPKPRYRYRKHDLMSITMPRSIATRHRIKVVDGFQINRGIEPG